MSLLDQARAVSVLIVEDEALVLMNLEDMLDELGHRIAWSAMRLDRARLLVAAGALADVAILDVNIAGETVFPLARMLTERKVPILFATGYGRIGIPDEFRDCTVLQKPYTASDVAAGLRQALLPVLPVSAQAAALAAAPSSRAR